MALATFVGSLTPPTLTGNQSYTGVGFQPKIVFFWVTNNTADGSAANANLSFGVGISSSDRRSTSCICQNIASGNFNAAGHDDTKCIYNLTTIGAVLMAADLVSLDSDGFTLNWTTVNVTQEKVVYMALGGADLTNVKTGQFTRPTSTGNQATTGVGFKPDSILLFGFRDTTSAPPANSTTTSPRPRFGFGKSSSSRAQVSTRMDAGIGSRGYTRTASIFSAIDDATNNLIAEADLVSLDSDGFTLNWTTVDANARYVFYIALKGGQFGIGSFNQSTSTGNQAITGNGFTPTGLLLLSRGLAASTTVDAPGTFSIGAAADSTHRFAIWLGETDSISANDGGTNLDTTKVLKTFAPGGGTPTAKTAADFVSFDSDGFTINNTTADATARQIIYFTVGNAAVASSQGGYMPVSGFFG